MVGAFFNFQTYLSRLSSQRQSTKQTLKSNASFLSLNTTPTQKQPPLGLSILRAQPLDESFVFTIASQGFFGKLVQAKTDPSFFKKATLRANPFWKTLQAPSKIIYFQSSSMQPCVVVVGGSLKMHTLYPLENRTFSLSIIMIYLLQGLVLGLDNGLAKTPPMGWNSWNHFGCKVSQTLIKQTADKIVQLGLDKKGYKYINIDDCWQVIRNPNTKQIVPDPVTFKSGMKELADYVHSKGLKFGLYSDAGYKTCQGRPGSLGFEDIDAKTYASWGVDYLKYDNCNDEKSIPPHTRYATMRDALNKTGRPIVYSICDWGVQKPWQWGWQTGNSWRTTFDISDKFASFVNILDLQNGLQKFAKVGGWNDPDMLQVGNGGMSTVEYQSHFSLWAILKAPLLIGCDLNNLKAQHLAILGNQQIIALNQDALGIQASMVKQINGNAVQLYACPLADGSVGIVIFNRDARSNSFFVNTTDLNLASVSSYSVRDLVSHSQLGVYTQPGFRVDNIQSHGSMTFKITPVKKAKEQQTQ